MERKKNGMMERMKAARRRTSDLEREKVSMVMEIGSKDHMMLAAGCLQNKGRQRGRRWWSVDPI